MALDIQITSVSSAQLKNLTASPIAITPSPATGKKIVPLFLHMQFKFGTVDYTVPASYAFLLTGGSYSTDLTQLVPFYANNFINVGENADAFGPLSWSGSNSTALPTGPFQLQSNSASELSDGDGTMLVSVIYATVDLA